MSPMRRAMASVAVVLCALTVTAGCGSDASGAGDSSGPKVIAVTITGDSVTPNGERVDVAVGQDIELKVTADEPGEIHVHSSPEQQFEYNAGATTVTIKGIDQPGTVDVESHALDKVIVQLEVS
jgi:ABC-type glycerol-3-phosphate transport system substrate-binding protein